MVWCGGGGGVHVVGGACGVVWDVRAISLPVSNVYAC